MKKIFLTLMTAFLIVMTSCSTKSPGEKAILAHFDSVGTFDDVEIRNLVKQDTVSLTADSFHTYKIKEIYNSYSDDSSDYEHAKRMSEIFKRDYYTENVKYYSDKMTESKAELDIILNKMKHFESMLGTDKEVFKDVFVYNVQFTLPNKNRFNNEIKVSNIRGSDKWIVEIEKLNLLDVIQKLN